MAKENIALIITSINDWAPSFRIYDSLDNFDLILVGDKKGPTINPLVRGDFLSIEAQTSLEFVSSKKLPFNHYCRKNIGYLFAIKNGYDVIYETDDDNLPNDCFPPSLSESDKMVCLANDDGCVNIYAKYSDLNLWPRGFPLSKITSKSVCTHEVLDCRVGVWQGLANLDPDVDAINRLVFNFTEVNFGKGRYAVKRNNFCPFNSQNTTWYREAFPLMYLPCTVPFRMTDILRSFITQRILWDQGLVVAFHEATVEQERNDHDLMADFLDEQSMYLDTEAIISVLRNLDLTNTTAVKSLEKCYLALIKAGFVNETEMQYLNCWIHDIEHMQTIV